MSDVVQSLRQALQAFVAPELREYRVLLTALDSKVDSRTAELRSEIAAMGSDLGAEIGGVRAEGAECEQSFAAKSTPSRRNWTG